MPDSAAPPATATAPAGHRRWVTAVFVAGIVVLAFNLRAAISSLPPLFPELSTQLRLSPAAIGALAATPVLCFAIFSGVAAPLSRRFGDERVLLAALVLLAVGLLGRGVQPGWLLYPGTVLAAAAIALMNVLLPSLVKRRQPDRAGLLIGVYLLSLAAGAILASLVAVPMFQASSGSIPLALGVWALPAAAAALAWLPQWRFRTVPAGALPRGEQPRLKVARHALAWQVMAFMGLQSLIYYATLSWLPTLFRDRGADAVHAGTLLAVMNLGNAVTAMLMPMLAHRTRDQRGLVALTIAASAAGLSGAWFLPLGGAAAWVLLLGLGQGAGLGLAIYVTMARAPDPAAAASLSGFAQGAGYLVATAGPLLIGFLHTASGGWTIPVVVLLAVLAAELAAGWQAGRAMTLGTQPGTG
ncbi:MAG TPA: MFS transporter [Streptosporangiaceae bacterium]|nr:MFS transporter [Streptosporangiaceae bacterium]